MILLTVVASILIAAVTIIQFNKQSREYHEQRLERKENHLIVNLNYFISENNMDYLDSIPESKIYEITDIHEIPFELYSLDGKLLSSSLEKKVIGEIKILSQKYYFFLANLPHQDM